MNGVVSQNHIGTVPLGRIKQATQRPLSKEATTRADRILLVVSIVVLPLENHIPSIMGFSVLWVLFAVIGLHLLLNHSRALFRTWSHPVFLSAYLLLFIGIIVEISHPNPNYRELASIGQMITGAVLIASLCRDRKALSAGIGGYLVAGVWLSVLLYLTSYGALSGISNADAGNLNYAEVTHIRTEVFKDSPLEANLNLMALVAAQGVVVALTLMMTSKQLIRKIGFGLCALFCVVATFLPLSRSGVITAVVACGCVMYSLGLKHSKTILIAALVCGSGVFFVPNVVWSRMKFSFGNSAVEQKDGRAKVYDKAIEHFGEYAAFGVGSGNFWKSPELRFRFADGVGAHNGFLQVTIYWGIAGLLALIAVVVQVWRYVPRGARNDGLALCIVGISVTLLCVLMSIHNLYSKEFTLGIGLLVGARRWIWPERRLREMTQALRRHPKMPGVRLVRNLEGE